MWYQNSFRRHLLDMHINDWHNGIFFSEFSPTEYYENLKKANVKSAMIYLQSHVGYCYYPTKVGHMHSAFVGRENDVKKLVELCHDGGIDVIAYYSINYNNIEAESHPTWKIKREPGENPETDFSGSRYDFCCPNNKEYIEFVKKQIKEMTDYAHFDGMFFDMPFWCVPCYCKHCTEKWKESFPNDSKPERNGYLWDEYIKIKEKWTDEYLGEITDYVHSIDPNLSVYYNYAYSVLGANEYIGSEIINNRQDYASGDIYRGFAAQSFACKYFYNVTPNQPFEYMTGRCDRSLACHTVTKSDDKLRLATMLTVAHHGANFFIDAIDPKGTMDKRFYEKLGKLYREVEFYEPYMKRGKMKGDVGLFFCLEGVGMLEQSEFAHYNATVAQSKNLAKENISYGIISQRTVEKVFDYKAVIIANSENLTDNTVEVLEKYVKGGGILYFSGGKEHKLLKKFLGTEVIKYTDAEYTYLAPKKEYESTFADFNSDYPLACQCKLPLIEKTEGAEVLATVTLPYQKENEPGAFASIHSNPPGTPTDYPGVVLKKVGKGTVIWSAATIEAKHIKVYRTCMRNLLEFAGLKYSLVTNAREDVETVVFEDEKGLLLSTVSVTEEENSVTVAPFEISVKCDRPKKVYCVTEEKEIPFEYRDGFVKFKTLEFNIFHMYEIVK